MAQDIIAGQVPQQIYLQNAATANGNGVAANVSECSGPMTVEIVNTGTGTCTVTLKGYYDSPAGTQLNAAGYAVGYHRIDGQTATTRAVAAISVAANSAAVYQVEDYYAFLQAVISAVAGSVAVTVRVNTLPE